MHSTHPAPPCSARSVRCPDRLPANVCSRWGDRKAHSCRGGPLDVPRTAEAGIFGLTVGIVGFSGDFAPRGWDRLGLPRETPGQCPAGNKEARVALPPQSHLVEPPKSQLGRLCWSRSQRGRGPQLIWARPGCGARPGPARHAPRAAAVSVAVPPPGGALGQRAAKGSSKSSTKSSSDHPAKSPPSESSGGSPCGMEASSGRSGPSGNGTDSSSPTAGWGAEC